MNEKKDITGITKDTYNRIAPVYDLMEGVVERLFYSKWRRILWNKVEGNKILEVGVGTGKNIPYYPADKEIVAIDFSVKMLQRAMKRANDLGIKMHFSQMDIESLEFEDDTFDTVVGSFVFCSVPDPIKGLQEIKRVSKEDGKVLLLEHVLHENRILGGLMNLANPFISRIMGPNINRKTIENVATIGLEIESVTDLFIGIFKLIEARKRRGLINNNRDSKV